MIQATEDFLSYLNEHRDLREAVLNMVRFRRSRRGGSKVSLGEFITSNVTYWCNFSHSAHPDYLLPVPPQVHLHEQWGRVKVEVLHQLVDDIDDLSLIDPAAVEQWVNENTEGSR